MWSRRRKWSRGGEQEGEDEGEGLPGTIDGVFVGQHQHEGVERRGQHRRLDSVSRVAETMSAERLELQSEER